MERLVLETFLPYRLTRLGAAVSERLKPIYGKKYRLTIPEWRVMATLGQFGRLTAKQVGVHSAMHKTKVSRAVAKLEERRWLKRSPNAADRREEVLSLTPAGIKAYEGIVPEMQAFVDRIHGELGPKWMQAIEEALVSLERCLRAERLLVETQASDDEG